MSISGKVSPPNAGGTLSTPAPGKARDAKESFALVRSEPPSITLCVITGYSGAFPEKGAAHISEETGSRLDGFSALKSGSRTHGKQFSKGQNYWYSYVVGEDESPLAIGLLGIRLKSDEGKNSSTSLYAAWRILYSGCGGVKENFYAVRRLLPSTEAINV
jgi:hypothetical protein